MRSIAAKLAGDDEAAARVELTLPETGVCGGAGLFDETADPADAGGGAGGCCGPADASSEAVTRPPVGAVIVPLVGSVDPS